MLNKIKNKIKKIMRYRNKEFLKRMMIVHLQDKNIYEKEKGIELKKYCDEEIIISLTTHGKRINTVYLTIESLFNQLVRANRIILWLSRDEFKLDTLPITLKRLQNRGLEIEFCNDLKPYTKIIPTLKKYSKSIVITVDDDIIYPSYFVQNLFYQYLENKKNVYFYRGHKIKIKGREFEEYLKWEHEILEKEESYIYFPTGVGGVLYPPGCFHKDVLREDIFLKICPLADDVWLKAMTLLNNIKCKKVEENYNEDFFSLEEVQDIGLCHINVINKKNDIQIKELNSKYGLVKKLIELEKIENGVGKNEKNMEVF